MGSTMIAVDSAGMIATNKSILELLEKQDARLASIEQQLKEKREENPNYWAASWPILLGTLVGLLASLVLAWLNNRRENKKYVSVIVGNLYQRRKQMLQMAYTMQESKIMLAYYGELVSRDGDNEVFKAQSQAEFYKDRGNSLITPFTELKGEFHKYVGEFTIYKNRDRAIIDLLMQKLDECTFANYSFKNLSDEELVAFDKDKEDELTALIIRETFEKITAIIIDYIADGDLKKTTIEEIKRTNYREKHNELLRNRGIIRSPDLSVPR
jgi:hypothetical protein